MGDVILRQDNRITMARYELSLIEKRVMYFVLKEIRKQFVLSESGQRDLFDDLVVKMESSKLTKEVYSDNPARVKQALKSLRLRSFEFDNGEPEDSTKHHWFEVGFINWAEWNKDGGSVDVQISSKILPFYVELTSQYTEYSLVVAMSLKSKWSQRMYELCAQWRSAGGFQVSIVELREMFKLENEYDRYGSFKKFVLDVAQKELKALYDKGECDLYFNYSEKKEGRSVVALSFKIIKSNDQESVSHQDIDYMLRTELHSMFDTKRQPKNLTFVGELMTILRLNPDDLERCYKKLLYVRQNIPKEEEARYMRFVINEEFLKKE